MTRVRAYYNEIDPGAVAWLRRLIQFGVLPDGEVDTRSIVDVQPGDLRGFDQCHFFAGIGGWAYAALLAGWPLDRQLWTGSCPCQPFSVAGKGEGVDDPRHLWPAWFRLIEECRPAVIVGEQTAGEDGLYWLDGVYVHLEGADYAVAAADLCAACVGTFHLRQRLWFVADTDRAGQRTGPGGEGGAGEQAGDDPLGRGPGGELGDADESRREGDGPEALHGGRDRRGPVAGALGSGATDLVGDAAGPGLQRHPGHGDGPGGRPRQAGHDGSASAPDALAHADPGGRGVDGGAAGDREAIEPEPHPEQRGGDERLADPERAERGPGQRHDLDDRQDRQRPQATGRSSARRQARALADADRRGTRELDRELRGDEGEHDQREALRDHALIGDGTGFWDAVEWIACRDGKARPIEPGITPLAHGVSGRVAVRRALHRGEVVTELVHHYSRTTALKGFGNAIVPQLGALVLTAYLESRS